MRLGLTVWQGNSARGDAAKRIWTPRQAHPPPTSPSKPYRPRGVDDVEPSDITGDNAVSSSVTTTSAAQSIRVLRLLLRTCMFQLPAAQGLIVSAANPVASARMAASKYTVKSVSARADHLS
jgi:hypothetical protein